MIHEFTKNVLMFPRQWANSIVRWISGIHSPTDTIRIGNDMSPSEGRSMTLDVNVEVLYKLIKERIDNDFVAKNALDKIVDKTTIAYSNGVLSVSSDLIRQLKA